LVGLSAGHLFGKHQTRVAVKAGSFLRDYVYVLLEMLAPALTRDVVQDALDGESSV
jgi:LysR family cys regulon transcriptional activator